MMRLILHTLFWAGVLVFFTFLFGVGNEIYSNVFYFSLFIMPVTIATTYVTIYKLIPEYLITKRYFLFGVYGLYTLIISSFLILYSIFIASVYLAHFSFDSINPISRNVLFILCSIYLVTIIVSAFKLLKLNLNNASKNNQLETKMLETQLKLKENELNYLKMQIHPHFLFNTLNTLYGFSLKQSDETPEMILKLSNLLDYLLYQIDKPFVNLKDEMNHIKDYISLEELRFNDSLDVKIVEEYQPKQNRIAPMLFLPLVENSFKHGQIDNGKLWIDIKVLTDENSIHFIIKNKFRNLKIGGKGIGLENIKKRLEILYENSYYLEIDTSNNIFTIDLLLKINEDD